MLLFCLFIVKSPSCIPCKQRSLLIVPHSGRCLVRQDRLQMEKKTRYNSLDVKILNNQNKIKGNIYDKLETV